MSAADFSPQWWSSCPSPLSSVFHDDFTLDSEPLPSYDPAPDEEGERHEHHDENQGQEAHDDDDTQEVQQDEQPPPTFPCSVRDTTCSVTKQAPVVRPKPARREEVDEPVTKKIKVERRWMLRDNTSLLRETYTPTPSTTEYGADVEAFLRILGAVLVPDPTGFLVLDAAHTNGTSLWTFIFSLLGRSAMGQNVLSESSAWKLMHHYQQRLQRTDPELREEIMGDLDWKKPKTARLFSIVLPRPQSPTKRKKKPIPTKTETVRGYFYMGVSLRDPQTDLMLAGDLERVLQHLAPGVSTEVVKEALGQYKQLWASHKPLPLELVRYRRTITE